jgi:hypothetical protein
MQNDRTHKMAEEALARLSAELEAGRSDALNRYLSAMGKFHRYSWNNVLLIESQRPTATHVAGFHTWHDLGRSVKKGEKGIAILAPVIVRAKDVPDPSNAEAKEIFRVSGFRTAYVFDIGQTEGKPLPAFATTNGDPKDFAERLKFIVAKRGISVEYDPTIQPAQGVSTGGHIRLQPGLSPSEEFSVLAHELAHEMIHHGKDAPSLPTLVRETQAEAVAYVVCQAAGLETNGAAADYIALYNGDKKTLAESLSIIQVTSAKILDDLLPEERHRPSPVRADSIPDAHEWGSIDTLVSRSSNAEPAPSANRTPELTQDSPQLDR